MKKILLLFIFELFVSGLTQAQTNSLLDKTVDLDLFSGTKKEFLKLLEQKSGVMFSYTNEIKLTEVVTIPKQKNTIKEYLDLLFPDHSVEYKEVSEKILLIKKNTGQQGNLVQKIRGIISDMESGFPIPGANVVIVGTNPVTGTVTNTEGEFVLDNIQVGRYTLQASFIGYESKTIPEILVGSAKEVFLNIHLSENAYQIKEIVVKPTSAKGAPLNEMAAVSSRSFSIEEGKRYPASIDDPGRMALVYAGVSTADDASNEIIIRGNTPTGLLWRLEGIEIPSPNHFYEEGSSAGFVSMLSANMVGKSDFFTGAFPAEYGNASSGVFDIYLRNGNNKEKEYTFQIGILGTDFAVEGPFSKNYAGSYLINYRYSTFGLIEKMGLELRESLIPAFQDLCFKFYFPTKNIGTFSLWGLGGSGDATVNALDDPREWEDWEDRQTDVSITKMAVAGLTHQIFFNNTTYLRTSISLAGHKSINDVWFYNDSMRFVHDNSGNFTNSFLRVSSTFNKKIFSRLSFKSGLILSREYFDYFEKYYPLNIENIKEEGESYYLQAFVQSKIKLSNKLTFTPGIHYLFLELNKNNSVEPRAGLSYTINKNNIIGLGFGIHSKTELLSTYFIRRKLPDNSYSYPNKFIDLAKSYHYVLSYDHYFNDDFHSKIECYYQNSVNVPVLNAYPYTYTPFNGEKVYDTLVNEGYGRNKGLEITIEKFFTQGYFFLITGSLYDAKIKYLDKKWYNSRYNGGFIGNLVGGQEFKTGRLKNNFLNLNGKMIFSGGRRITPVNGNIFENMDDFDYDHSKSYSKQLKKYFRFDASISYRLNRRNVSHVFSLDIQNITNRKNVLELNYSAYRENVNSDFIITENAVYQMGIMPVFKYRVEF